MNSQHDRSSKWVVHKFGGTSVAGADRYKNVYEVLKSEPGTKKAIVVSAMSKVTDALIELTDLARLQNLEYLTKLNALKIRHLETIDQLLPHGANHQDNLALQNELKQTVQKDFEDLEEILRGIYLVRIASERAVELVSGFGEVWSAQILNAYIKSQGQRCTWIDARLLLTVQALSKDSPVNSEAPVLIDWSASQSKIDIWLKKHSEEIVVITGFVAATEDGIPTTLKRNGSDYSASIFGALLGASTITIWTDVDGVLSADPRLVPEAVVLEDMSYDEATELAYFGAKVVHPSTMAPAIARKIPLFIRNTFNAKHPGTLIHTSSKSDLPVKGFSTVEKIALVNVEGTGMIGVPGVAQRLFGALREVNISVIMISQASSEHSICFAIPSAQASLAKQTLDKAFFSELHHGLIQKIEVADDCSVLAAVGDNMVSQTGVAARFFSALSRAGVNIRAIAQGSSERNISVVVSRADSTRALRAAHAGFFLSNHTLSIGLIGTGWIGATLLNQLQEAQERLLESKIDLRIRAIANSKAMELAEGGLDLKNWKSDFEKKAISLDLEKFAKHVKAEHLPHAVIIDCTASEAIAQVYPHWLAQGIHIITPNKKANTSSMDFYQKLKAAAYRHQKHFLYETTVGAGLPIINTLRDLVQTGDHLLEVEGILSGTLSFLFNTFSSEKPFSQVVLEAKAKGYTEPDPRDDLSGLDVARKLVILAREAGIRIELQNVQLNGLVPEVLKKVSVEEYLKDLPKFDNEMLEMARAAESQNEVLRYVGRINEKGEASVALKRYPKNHPFAQTKATDNIVAFRTKRYHAQPLIVQGPGAGPDVTAAGVFADLLRLSTYLGANLGPSL